MRPAPSADLRRALGSVTAWPADLAPDDRYVALPELVASGLSERVAARLGGADPRVGHSSVSMGVASRLWSLTLVPWVRAGLVADPDAVCGRDERGSVVLGVRGGRGLGGVTPDDLREVVVAVLAPLVATLPLADRLHWGNVAGSLAAVPRVHGADTAEAVTWLLAQGPWAGLVEDPPPRRRRTCCLFYLAPGAGLCGDCALDRVPA